MSMKLLLSALLLLIAARGVLGAPCEREDFETRVSGESECLLMRRYGSIEPATMVVWLHGNLTSGNPANYHFPIAQKAAVNFASDRVMSVALVRPGYPDGTGESSSGSDYGRGDNWTRRNIAAVGAAIERLRLKYKPGTVIIVGHSGGAATAAVLLGMKPQLADAAILVSCPCELLAWRRDRGRGGQWISENPIQWVDKVSVTTKVIALTGAKDSTTSPELAKTYAEALKARGIDAVFQPIPDEAHNDALRSAAVSDAISRLLRVLRR
jgi:pimeloyl-ACP methyl ester carboxylesterase